MQLLLQTRAVQLGERSRRQFEVDKFCSISVSRD